MKQKAVFALRRFMNAILFFIAGIFIAVNLGVFGFSGSPAVLTGLTITWSVAWCVTSIHLLLYRGVLAKRHLCSDKKAEKKINQEIIALRHSTHSKIRACLTTGTAVAAMAMDLYKIQQPTPAHIARVIGSTIWINLGVYEIWLAGKYERKQENQPNKIVRPCNLRISTHHMICAVIFFTAGVCYAIGVWTDDDRSPLKVDASQAWLIPIPNLCWLLAALNELTRMFEVILTEPVIISQESEHDSENDIEAVHVTEVQPEVKPEAVHVTEAQPEVEPELSIPASSMSSI